MTPTAAVDSLPTAAPSSAAEGASIIRTPFARSNGTTLSRLLRDASGPMTASLSFPRNAASRTSWTPTTTRRPFRPTPSNRSNLLDVAASIAIAESTGTAASLPLARRLAASRTVARSIAAFLGSAIFSVFRQLIEHRNDAIGFLGRDARQPKQIFALEVDDVIQCAIAAVFEHGNRGRRHAFDLG